MKELLFLNMLARGKRVKKESIWSVIWTIFPIGIFFVLVPPKMLWFEFNVSKSIVMKIFVVALLVLVLFLLYSLVMGLIKYFKAKNNTDVVSIPSETPVLYLSDIEKIQNKKSANHKLTFRYETDKGIEEISFKTAKFAKFNNFDKELLKLKVDDFIIIHGDMHITKPSLKKMMYYDLTDLSVEMIDVDEEE